MFGRKPRLPVDVMYGAAPTDSVPPCQYVMDLQSHLRLADQKVRETMATSHHRQKELYNSRVHGKCGQQRYSNLQVFIKNCIHQNTLKMIAIQNLYALSNSLGRFRSLHPLLLKIAFTSNIDQEGYDFSRDNGVQRLNLSQ